MVPGDGAKPIEVPSCYRLPYLVRLPKPGTYRLELTGTGDYAFHFVTVKPRTVPARLGEQVTGRLEVPGRVDRREFDAAGASTVRVSGGTGLCTAITMQVYDARTGERLGLDVPAPLCDGLSQPLPDPAGRYTVEVSSRGGVVGDYAFTLGR
ncbi:hypothetical protein [Dactylosporangium sp. NPDC048998]|uniref:hypothetical protein n=1 Tax=Dactylosporangium sp. NPDC048998 TaxID=3363976 RepID=UPI0037105B9D